MYDINGKGIRYGDRVNVLRLGLTGRIIGVFASDSSDFYIKVKLSKGRMAKVKSGKELEKVI